MTNEFDDKKDDEKNSENSAQYSAIAENFSLRDMFNFKNVTIDERTLYFKEAINSLKDCGAHLYLRTLTGATDHQVKVREHGEREEKTMIMFGSNNYLGFGNHPYIISKVKEAIDKFGVGVGGPPLLNGTTTLHQQLEARLARFKGKEAAMLFSSGYQANLGWVAGLVNNGDFFIYDELSHASVMDGIKMVKGSVDSKDAKFFRFRHNNMEHLERILKRIRSDKENDLKQIFVTVEGVYSMDGDKAPLKELVKICKQYNAFSVIDDAHGTGVIGQNGKGTVHYFGCENEVDLIMGTFSKSFSTTGGFLAGNENIINYLRYFARSYMFSAHMPPTTAATVLAGLDLLETDNTRLNQLQANIKYFAGKLKGIGIFTTSSDSAIVPIFIPESCNIKKLCRALHDKGIFLNSIEYPAVPKNQQRLRISLMATHTKADLDRLITVLQEHRDELVTIQ